jgi:membrane associated rhomboid family serine protease
MIPLRDSQPSNTTPVVTIGIIAVNVAVFLYEISLDQFSLNHLMGNFGVVPYNWTETGFATALLTHGSTLVTTMFLHGGWLHVIGNMWFLWIYGDNVEDILGRWKYLGFYLACGVTAALAQMLVSLDSRTPIIGASGAIAGVMGAYLVKFPRSRITTVVWIVVFVTVIEIPASLILLYWLFIQVLSSASEWGVSAAAQRGGTAWFAHVGGFAAGVLLILLLKTRPPYRHNRVVHW